MIFSPETIERLNALTMAVADPVTDLQAILSVLLDDLGAAVPSFLGLTMTLSLHGSPVVLTTLKADLALTAAASLRLPLARWTGGGDTDAIIFYARQPGAFVDLDADVAYAEGHHGGVVLDGHLPSGPYPPPPPGITGLADLSVVNRAVGVLLDRGHTLAEARAVLNGATVGGAVSALDRARDVLHSVRPVPRTAGP